MIIEFKFIASCECKKESHFDKLTPLHLEIAIFLYTIENIYPNNGQNIE